MLTSLPSWSRKCNNLQEVINSAKVAIDILSKKRLSSTVIEKFKKFLDSGDKIDPGFFHTMKGSIGMPTKRFRMKTNKEGYDDSLTYHFDKHGSQFEPKIKSKQEYLRRAKKFAAQMSDDILTLNLNGKFIRYNPVSKEIIYIGPEGIGTYYIADIKYINKNSPGRQYKSVEEWLYYREWRPSALHVNPTDD